MSQMSEIVHDVCAYVQSISAKSGIKDIVVGLSIGGEQRYLLAGEPLDNDVSESLSERVFDISCVFKPLIAVVALNLSDKGVLDLDAPIDLYVPELARRASHPDITVRHLLSHTPGYRGFHVFLPFGILGDDATQFARLRSAEQIFLPGSVCSYENSSIALVGEITRRVTGEPIGVLVKKEIFEPLGIASPRLRETSAPFGAVAMTMPDLMKVVEALMGPSILTDRTTSRLQQKVVEIPRLASSAAASLLPIGAASGLMCFRDEFRGYDGVNPTQAIGFRFHRASRAAIVLGIDRPAQALRRILLEGIRATTARKPQTPRLPVASIDGYDAQEISGYYVGNHAWDVEVAVRRSRITLVGRGASSMAFKLEGVPQDDGLVFLQGGTPGFEPMFFRYAPTGDISLVLGMSAFRKMPSWRASL